MPTKIVDIKPRPNGKSAFLVFPSTRSQIVRSGATAPSGTGTIIASPVSGGLVVALSNLSETNNNSVAVEHTGADLGAPVEFGINPDMDKALGFTSVEDIYRRFYSRRDQIANADKTGVQRFFFDLDRWSNAFLLPYSNLPRGASAVAERIELGRVVGLALGSSMAARWAGQDPQAPTPAVLTEIGKISQIVKDAAAPVYGYNNGGWAAVSNALLEFAAGTIRERIFVGMAGGEPVFWNAAEPDSFMIFYFAELALAAIAIPEYKEMWEALLPATVKMQSYFLARFMDKNIISLKDYGAPGDVLQWCVRKQIDVLYDSGTGNDPAILGVRIQQNLRAAGLKLEAT